MPRAPTTRNVELRARADGGFRFGVVADTHSQPHEDAEQHLRALRPDAILHAGDIGELSVLERFARIAPVYAVRGNIDVHARNIPDVFTLDVLRAGAPTLRILLVHIAVYGPKLRADVARLAARERASLVVCGHSHVPFMGRDRGLGIFNPGSIGPRRFQLPILFGTMDVTPAGVRLAHIDCETGLSWSP